MRSKLAAATGLCAARSTVKQAKNAHLCSCGVMLSFCTMSWCASCSVFLLFAGGGSMLAPPPDPPAACPAASVSAMLCNSCMKQRETSGMYFAISFLRSALSRRAAAATKRRLICWQHAVMHFFTVSCNTPLSSPMYSATTTTKESGDIF